MDATNDFDLNSMLEQPLPINDQVQVRIQQYMNVLSELQGQQVELKQRLSKVTASCKKVKQELATLMRLYGVGEVSAKGITFSITTKQRKKKPPARLQRQLLEQLAGPEVAKNFFNQLDSHTDIQSIESLELKDA